MEPFDWKREEGLYDQAPLGEIRPDVQVDECFSEIKEVYDDTGLGCRFCANPLPVYDERTALVPLYNCRSKAGVAHFVCQSCIDLAITGAPFDKVTNWGGVTTVAA